MDFKEVQRCLDAAGFIGAWQVDFTTHKYRSTQSCGLMFGITKGVSTEGVNLDLLDPAYHPEDLEMVKRIRRGLAGSGGRYQLQYKLRDMKNGDYIPVKSLMNVYTDRFGLKREAMGVLFKAPTDQLFEPANNSTNYDSTLQALADAANAVKALGYPHFHVILQTLFKKIAKDAIVRFFDR